MRNTVRKKKETSLEEKHSNSFRTDNSVEDEMQINYLYEQMNKLSDVKREALILFEINGFSIKEVAELQGATEGAVKVMLSRARKELKNLMIDEPNILKENAITT